jgi:hypothetical protein
MLYNGPIALGMMCSRVGPSCSIGPSLTGRRNGPNTVGIATVADAAPSAISSIAPDTTVVVGTTESTCRCRSILLTSLTASLWGTIQLVVGEPGVGR